MTRTIEELDHRESNGISVSLLWNRRTNELTVRVEDSAEHEGFELDCGAHEALDVFRHPYAYAAIRPVRHRRPTTVAQI